MMMMRNAMLFVMCGFFVVGCGTNGGKYPLSQPTWRVETIYIKGDTRTKIRGGDQTPSDVVGPGYKFVQVTNNTPSSFRIGGEWEIPSSSFKVLYSMEEKKMFYNTLVSGHCVGSLIKVVDAVTNQKESLEVKIESCKSLY